MGKWRRREGEPIGFGEGFGDCNGATLYTMLGGGNGLRSNGIDGDAIHDKEKTI
jgi:hypothetical protein